MDEYHKIQTVFKRNPANKFRTLLDGEYALPEFEYLKGNNWIFTEKVDGTNIRVMYSGKLAEIPDKITFGGKTERAQIPATLYTALDDTFIPKMDIFREIGPCCLYGEGYGPKIQKGGGNYRDDQGFVLFDVKIGDWWLQRADVEDIASKLGIDVVPIIGEGSLALMIAKVRGKFLSQWGNFPAEGIVARPEVELKTRSGHRIITKLKLKDFR